MSALNFVLQEDMVMVATDTLALSGDTNRPSHFQTKFYPIPHLDGIICGTGVSQFIAQWALQVQTSMLVKNIPHLNEFTTEQLRKLWTELRLNDVFTSTIYHFGYDADLEKFRGYVYRSEKNFISEELSYGFGTKPPVPNFKPTGNPVDDFKEVISIQREEDLSHPQENRIGIGGDIQLALLKPSQITIVHTHRFEDFEELYKQMCQELPANKMKDEE
jgi:hypothetical protein